MEHIIKHKLSTIQPCVLRWQYAAEANVFQGGVGSVRVEATPSTQEPIDSQEALPFAFMPELAAIPQAIVSCVKSESTNMC